LFTKIKSPGSNVFSIDEDGMVNTSKKKALITITVIKANNKALSQSFTVFNG